MGPYGRPVLEEIFIDKITSIGAHLNTIPSADATNILGNTRFLVYSKQRTGGRSSLILQHVDGITGNKVGDPVILLEADLLARNVKIDRGGRFALFIVDDTKIGSGLGYLALDATGHPSGTPKILTDLAVAGISLLNENLE